MNFYNQNIYKTKFLFIFIIVIFLFSGCSEDPTEPEINGVLIEHYAMSNSDDPHLSPILTNGESYQILMKNNGKYYDWFVSGEDVAVRYKNFIFTEGLKLNGSIEVWLYRLNKN